VDLGCGEGFTTTVLAALGARVLALDISEANLEITGRRAVANGVEANVTLLHSDAARIPIRDGITDHVLCVSALQQVNPLLSARQIRRILRPGGTAVFKQPLAAPIVLGTLKTLLAEDEFITRPRYPLHMPDVEAVSRAVGRPGRCRGFWLTTRLLVRMGVERDAITEASQKLDASLLRRFPSTRRFASPLVWEACKES
jgi:ubiquinone/menaquinone biosynthesis C-methylase UbiE